MALRKAGGNPKFTRIPGFGHYVWEKAQGNELFEWMITQRRSSAVARGK